MSESNTPVVHSIKEGDFLISAELWQQNQERSQILLRYFALTIKEDKQRLWLALDSLENINACETFSFLSGKVIEPVLVESTHLKALLQQFSQHSLKIEENPHLLYQANERENKAESAVETLEKTDEPVIRLLDSVFESALRQNASDIHLEPQRHVLQVRFRIDGVLKLQPAINLGLAGRLISRLKLLAKLDISETRLPQDGRFQFKTTFSDVLDFRLSTLATQFGEKAVLRLQQNKPVKLEFSALGMTDLQQQQFQWALSQPQGLILVTGPTGSGKSITLYTALEWLNSTDKHIMTAEDPIEIELSGIIQTQVNNPIGLDFSRLLRTFLRQDPDIIMLGEIRDEESAAMALRAAQTGHLVLSTLHTNDAKSAIARLQQLGIAPYEIESSLLLVIAQRLVRKKTAQGYVGRVGIYQFLHYEQGQYRLDFDSLYASGMDKVRSEITDFAELNRILGQQLDG